MGINAKRIKNLDNLLKYANDKGWTAHLDQSGYDKEWRCYLFPAKGGGMIMGESKPTPYTALKDALSKINL